MQLYFKHARMHIRSAMEYRKSFWILLFVQVLTPFTSLLGILFLFERFGQVDGWSFPQVLLCFSVTYLSFSLAECFGRGFDVFSNLIRKGTFDRLLLQPRNLLLLTLCSDFAFNRIGKATLAVGLLVYAMCGLGIQWTVWKLFTLFLMVLGGAVTYLAVMTAFSALCFLTVEGIELANAFTDGGRELSSYPLSIYTKRLARFFTFVVPYGMVNYLPLLSILGRAPALQGLTPLYAFVFAAGCVGLFYWGVRHYRSAG